MITIPLCPGDPTAKAAEGPRAGVKRAPWQQVAAALPSGVSVESGPSRGFTHTTSDSGRRDQAAHLQGFSFSSFSKVILVIFINVYTMQNYHVSPLSGPPTTAPAFEHPLSHWTGACKARAGKHGEGIAVSLRGVLIQHRLAYI